MSRPSSLSCVIPCLNEAANLNVLIPALLAALEPLADAVEIIVVDDGSTDGTPQVVQTWSHRFPAVVYLQLSRNFGKEAALSAGLAQARGRVVVSMDADLQHPPALIADMVRRWEDGADMVYAVREHRADESLFKRWGTRLFYKLMHTGGVDIPRDAGDFRLMDRRVVDALLMMPERNRFMKGLFAWVGFRSEPILYSPPERLHGTSTFKALNLFRFAVDGLTAFTTWPLRLLSVSGLGLSILSFAYGLFIVFKHLIYGDPVQGWTTLITVVLFFAGVQLISVGVLGEYTARIFDEVKNRPVFLVRDRVGQGLPAAVHPSAASAAWASGNPVAFTADPPADAPPGSVCCPPERPEPAQHESHEGNADQNRRQ